MAESAAEKEHRNFTGNRQKRKEKIQSFLLEKKSPMLRSTQGHMLI